MGSMLLAMRAGGILRNREGIQDTYPVFLGSYHCQRKNSEMRQSKELRENSVTH
jgi:hypothetical protein